VRNTRVEAEGAGRILLVDNDRDVADVVEAILLDEGFTVRVLVDVDPRLLHQLVEDFAPQCVLLDGQGPGQYGESWLYAAWLSDREPAVPTIMFTADQPAADEARHRQTPRSQAARFSDVLIKPFDILDLLAMVSRAVRPPESV
jgi:DNA-binding response OmpR family regulator